MLLFDKKEFYQDDFKDEADFEASVIKVQDKLFGPNRAYLDTKKKIGAKGKIRNIPDGYLLDLSSSKEPKLFVVENELARHQPLKHIAVQILEFSISFETNPTLLKDTIKNSIQKDKTAVLLCSKYIKHQGIENLDVLLERIIYGENKFNALVIIDEVDTELETALITRFQFPVEILSLKRFKSSKGELVYQFDPFLEDIESTKSKTTLPPLDASELDTIVVPAQEDGFKEVFLGGNCWYAIRIHNSMIPKIKHIAAYQVRPLSAITHIADVEEIKPWKDTGKYIVKFSGQAKKLKNPLKLVPKSSVTAPQAPRYTSIERIKKAKNLDEAF